MSTHDTGAPPLRPRPRPTPRPLRPGLAADLVVVPNRLRVRRVGEGDDRRWVPSAGGLATALTPLVSGWGCAWVGWSGDEGEVEPFAHEDAMLVPVGLSAGEITQFSDGFCNRTLWPLYHDAIRTPEFDRAWWSAYEEVNRRYAAPAWPRRAHSYGSTTTSCSSCPPCCGACALTCASVSSCTSRIRRKVCSCACRGAGSCSRGCSELTPSAARSPLPPATSPSSPTA